MDRQCSQVETHHYGSSDEVEGVLGVQFQILNFSLILLTYVLSNLD